MDNSDPGWSTVDISGKQADVFAPPCTRPFQRAVLFLHGASGRTIRDDPVFTAELARHGLPAVCPYAGQSWWLDRVCREFDETVSPMLFLREQIVRWIGEQWGVSCPAIGLLGVDMGGQGVLQLAYRHPREFPVVAAITPAIDFHMLWGQGSPLDDIFADPEAARQQTATLHIHPLNWPRHQMFVCDPHDIWHEGAERLASKLFSMGIPFESDLETSGGGHALQYNRMMAGRCLSFLADRLAMVEPPRR